MIKNPKLTLVGAGPGDPELITLKAIKALASADVVLHDALVSLDLLEHAPNAEIIYVGKRKGFHRYSQEEINELIVQKALSQGHVVRLKGGDPFIFGRGSEEIEYASRYGVETSVVPGISSCHAVPSGLDIPLTQRGISESFWVITGTTSARQLSNDVRLAAQSTATVIILMGMGKLREITGIYKNLGLGGLPVAVIQNGTLPGERHGIGTVDSIHGIVEEKKLGAPAIIVLGEVVRNAKGLQATYERFALEQAS